MYKKIAQNIFLAALFLGQVSFVSAQNYADTILLRPYGDRPMEPKVYSQGTATTITQPAGGQTTPTQTTQPVPASPKASDSKPTLRLNGFDIVKKVSGTLRLETTGVGKNCMAGVEQPISWKINPTANLDDPLILKTIADEAVKHDYRLRRISITNSKIEFYYLAPASLFGVLPVNYVFHITADANTFEFKLQNPKWLSFATSKHDMIASAFSQNIARILTPDVLDSLVKKSVTARHGIIIESTADALYQIPVYPYANSVWICTIIPYCWLWLILLGCLIGYISHILTRRKKKKLADRVRYHADAYDAGEPNFKRNQPLFSGSSEGVTDDSDITQTLEEYNKKKREEEPRGESGGRFAA